MMLKKELSHAARHHDVRTYAVKVADIMATKVVTVGPETPYHEIVALLLDHDISGLPVGVIRDHIMGRDTEWIRKSAARNARELMTSPVQTVSPTDDLAAAARLMLSKHLKRLPVIDDDGRLVGIVARHDLLRPFARTDGEIAEEVAALLADPMRTPDGHRVTFSVREGVVLLNGTTRFPSDVHVIVAFVSAIPGVVAVGDGISPRHDEPRVEPTFTVGATEH
jgi:CBS domain-containing protein